jgi:hypothetical protein
MTEFLQESGLAFSTLQSMYSLLSELIEEPGGWYGVQQVETWIFLYMQYFSMDNTLSPPLYLRCAPSRPSNFKEYYNIFHEGTTA